MGIERFISLTYPEALLLGAALAWAYWRAVRAKNVWRTTILILAVLLLCYPVLMFLTRSFDLYLVVDRSRSISDEGRQKEQEILDLAANQLRPGDRLSIVTFNERAFVEQPPLAGPPTKTFQIPYSPDASELSEGLATAVALADDRRQAKIFVLSDGEFTGRDPLHEAFNSAQRSIPIFFRDLKRADVFNLMISDADTPDRIPANEPFRIAFNVRATAPSPGRYRILRDNHPITGDPRRSASAATAATSSTAEDEGWRTFNFAAGDNRIAATDLVKRAGIHSYKMEFETTPKDRETIRTDNVAEQFVGVVGERPMLVINNTGQPDNLTRVLTAGGLDLSIASIKNFHFGINQLTGYKGIVLNNVSVTKLTIQQLEALRNFVLEEGGGLLVTGGNQSYAAGGYYRTALEPILPVSLEDRKQSRKIATAFSIIIDRSGSMSIRTPSGEPKIKLAAHAAAECVRLMTPADSVSVIPVDSAAHIAIPQQNVDNPDAIVSEVQRIESMGGGIFTYTGLLAAGSQIIKASQLNKHVLLFADANDAEEPGEYKTLMEDFKKAGITVSVVGMGTDHDADSEFLKDVALRGNGQVYFTEDVSQLVQFFTADTMTFSRKSFVEDAAPIQVRAGAFTISPDQRWKDFRAGGYNLLFTKDGADIALKTADSDDAPVLAFWQRGVGRVAALALDADGPFVAASPDYADIVLAAARWIMGSEVFDDLQVKSRLEGSTARVTMEVSAEERARASEATLELFTPSGRTITKPLVWESHDRLSADHRLNEQGAYRGLIHLAGKTYRVGPLSMPVSPEFANERGPDAGRHTLQSLAAATGGSEALDVRKVFERTRLGTTRSPVLTPFLVLFLLALVGDIAEQRFGYIAALKRRLKERRLRLPARRPIAKPRAETTAQLPAPERKSAAIKRRTERTKPNSQQTSDSEATSGQPTAPAAPPDELDYLAKSKQRAEKALRRGK